jgi:hypothetical protein
MIRITNFAANNGGGHYEGGRESRVYCTAACRTPYSVPPYVQALLLRKVSFYSDSGCLALVEKSPKAAKSSHQLQGNFDLRVRRQPGAEVSTRIRSPSFAASNGSVSRLPDLLCCKEYRKKVQPAGNTGSG